MSLGLVVENLSVEHVREKGVFLQKTQRLPVLTDISFRLEQGETLGVVGESGSGKTTLGRALAGFIAPSCGRILLDGVDMYGHDQPRKQNTKSPIQMLFQDSYEAMNPRMTIGQVVSEPLRLQGGLKAQEIKTRVLLHLQQVGLEPALMARTPDQVSGGQRQRAALARALAADPQVLVLDEPTSGLDVSLQARILNLLRGMQEGSALSYLFISHDIGAVCYLARRMLVLYRGLLVEEGPTMTIQERPAHPYTAALLATLPANTARKTTTESTPSPETPKAHGADPGCAFYALCPYARARCQKETPARTSLGEAHNVRCHYPLSLAMPRPERNP